MNVKAEIPRSIFTATCAVTFILIAYLFWPVSFAGKAGLEKEAFPNYCPNLITIFPESTQKNIFNNFFLTFLLPPAIFACVMQELDTQGRLSSAERLTYGMMFLTPNVGFYNPRYDLHAYFLQQEKNPSAYEFRTLAHYYETGMGVTENEQKAALLYKQYLITFLPLQRGAACQKQIDNSLSDTEKKVSFLEQEQINWLKDICTGQPENIYLQADHYLDSTHEEYAPVLAERLAFYLETIHDYKPAYNLYSRAIKARHGAVNR